MSCRTCYSQGKLSIFDLLRLLVLRPPHRIECLQVDFTLGSCLQPPYPPFISLFLTRVLVLNLPVLSQPGNKACVTMTFSRAMTMSLSRRSPMGPHPSNKDAPVLSLPHLLLFHRLF